MSLQLSDLDAYVVRKVSPYCADIIYASDPLFVRLESQNREPFTGNSRVSEVVLIGELNGGFMGKGESVDIKYVTTEAAIVVDMRMAWVNITLYAFDAMNNDGPEAVFSQVELKFLNASLKMAKILATNMYLNGQATNRQRYLNGLEEWYDDGTNFPNVGGQLRTDVNGTANGTVGGLNAYFATLTSFTLAQVNTAYQNACWGSDHPDIIPVTPNGWSLIWQSLQPSMRYGNTDNDLANVGFQNVKFNAADVVISRYLPTGSSPIGRMFLLNSKYIHWWFSQVPLFQYGWTGFKGAKDDLDVAGQFLVASNILVPSPRTGAQLQSTLF